LIKSIGLDVVDIARVKRLLEEKEHRFVEKILGESEILEYQKRRNKLEYLAGRFAAKEALVKALGALLKERPAWGKLQVLNGPDGFPKAVLDEGLIDLKCYNLHLSISHEKNIAAAVAVLEEVK